ncbi:MAG: hypothetical protein ACLFUR_02720 [Candidatus Hadarchaeia archaeon]
MQRCCICGKGAEFYHHGHWWCKEHNSSYSDGSVSVDGSEEDPAELSPNEVKLGLQWI